MAGLILLLMIAVPIIEISVFIQAGELIGLWPTLIIVILTALMGTALLRRQGLATLQRAQDSMNAGRPPVAELFDGLCLFVAGLLLLTPGFVTDAVGLLLFVPLFRTFILGGLIRRLSVSMSADFHGNGQPGARNAHDATIIEGEYHEVRPDPAPDDPENKLRPPE